MKLSRNRFTSWNLPNYDDKLEIDTQGVSAEEFEQFFNRLGQQECPSTHILKLQFAHKLTESQLEQLTTYIQSHPEGLIFSHLSFHVAQEQLQNPAFLDLLKALKTSSLKGLALRLPQEELTTSLASYLETTIINLVHYPVTLREYPSNREILNSKFTSFINQVIKKVQLYNQKLRWHVESPETIETPDVPDPYPKLENNDKSNKKIKIKELIHSKEKKTSYREYLTQEVQHVKIQQQQQEQLQDVEETIQVPVSEQQAEQGIFTGELVDFKRFKDRYYCEKEIEYELFGNIPQAIAYLSPEAAMKIGGGATGLSSALIALNLHNLPKNFVLKQTETGQLVLDYQESAEDTLDNPYTPKESLQRDNNSPIYDVMLPEAIQKKIEPLQLLINYRPLDNVWKLHKPLDNVWIRYGDMGIDYFLTALQGLDDKHPKLSQWIITHYLNDFPNWDRFMDDPQFIDTLDAIKHYDAAKLECFKSFLENRVNYAYAFSDLVKGFNTFWKDWEELAKKNAISPAELLGKYSVPSLGNPLVYMERLITILKNARNIPEQLACLNSTQKLSLRNYDAYYASTQEGYKIVSPEMGLSYDPLSANAKEFNPEASVYKVTWEELIQASQELPEEQFYQKAYRMLGQLQKSAPVHDFIKGVQEFSSPNLDELYRKGIHRNQFKVTEVIMKALFFVSHDRFKGEKNTLDLLNSLIEGILEKTQDSKSVLAHCLLDLFQKGIYLNEEEGMILCQSINLLHACEVDAASYIQKLMHSLQHNHYATLNYIHFLASNCVFKTEHVIHNKVFTQGIMARPVVYALDTAAYLMQDQNIESFYRSDLLLFAELLNKRIGERYSLSHKDGGWSGGLLSTPLNTENYYEGLTKELARCNLIRLTPDQAHKVGKIELSYLSPSKYKSTDRRQITIFYDKNSDSFQIGGTGSQDEYCHYSIKDAQVCQRLKQYTNRGATEITDLANLLAIEECKRTFKNLFGDVFNPQTLNELLGKRDGFIQVQDTVVYVDKIDHLDKVRKLADPIQTQLKPLMAKLEPNTLHLSTEEDVKLIQSFNTPRPTHLIEHLEEIQAILRLGIAAIPNNIEYAYKALIQAQHYINPAQFIKALHEITALPNYDEKAVDEVLKQHGFALKSDMPVLFARDSRTVKMELVDLILRLETRVDTSLIKRLERYNELMDLDRTALWRRVEELKEQHNSILFHAEAASTLIGIKKGIPKEAFCSLPKSPFTTFWETKITELYDFSEAKDFDKVNYLFTKIDNLGVQLSQLMAGSHFKDQQEQITQSFQEFVDFSHYDYEILMKLLSLLNDMPNRDYAPILHHFLKFGKEVKDNVQRSQYLSLVNSLHDTHFPTTYIVKCMSFYLEMNDKKQATVLIKTLQDLFATDIHDPVLQCIMQHNEVDASLCANIVQLTQGITVHRPVVAQLLSDLLDDKKIILSQLNSSSPEKTKNIIEIMALCYSSPHLKKIQLTPNHFKNLLRHLHDLKESELQTLHDFISANKVTIPCLETCLKTRNKQLPFSDVLLQFEKSPFGERDFKTQFDTRELERVINGLQNLNNKESAHYKYTYRKQMMEAFLFINRAGYDLPVYRNKPAKELTNAELSEIMHELKTGKFPQFDPFQKAVYSLALMREAMYRTTGEFPYSTQIIALLDCLMHEGDVIQNIDTGQGKSLIDTMKGMLLWLESDQVLISTSSLIDAQRDLQKFSPCLSLLKIPHAKNPIASSSPFEEFSTNGINYTTMAESALFFSRARGEHVKIGNVNDVISLVMNESDYTILDDKTIYRYAISGTSLMGEVHEWIYDGINQFVEKTEFRANITSEKQDIKALRQFLLLKAKELKKSQALIRKLPDEKLKIWIESAVQVNYTMKENVDYVLTPEPEEKRIHGVLRKTRLAKILMQDGKVSPNTQYGDGVQQLLYAKLNKKFGPGSFILEPESQMIISTNNKNWIDYYRSKNGRIWGSSGTVGSQVEIDIQYSKYGFEFSKVEPHQSKRVKFHNARLVAGEIKQFEAIADELSSKKWFTKKQPPALVFFKDIETAQRFYEFMVKTHPKEKVQFYMGLGDEKQTIDAAKEPDRITITTSALGRNTDIGYDREVGMKVIQTFVGRIREEIQRSGRTGREGSAGDVHFIINEQEFKNINQKKQYQLYLDEKAEQERAKNEELYTILGTLLQCVETDDKNFYKEKWSIFCKQVEIQYREELLNAQYDPKTFLEKVLKQFNEITDLNLTVDQLNKTRVKNNVSYEAYTKPVYVDDCIPAEIIAYQFLHPKDDTTLPIYKKQEVKYKLEQLFSSIRQENYASLNNDYIKYLNSGHTSMAVIREAHQEFLAEFLQQQVSRSQKSHPLERCFKSFGHLNQLTKDSHYLLMFKTIADIKEKEVDVESIKAAAQTMLQEYLDYSWFISQPKKQAAMNLIKDIQNIQSIEELLKSLAKSKLDTIRADTDLNKNSFWRQIKPVNALGESRFQSTLDRAIALANALSPNQNNTELLDDLTKEYKKTIKNPERFRFFSEDKSIDSAKKQMESVEYKDKSNAKVIEKSIESALEQYPRMRKPKG